MHDLDSYIQSQLLLAALSLSLEVLEPSDTSVFIAKIFRGRDAGLLFAQLSIFFDNVYCAKPRSSRASSIEAFVVCKGLKMGMASLSDALKRPMFLNTELERKIVPFVACGDLSGYDADATYSEEAQKVNEARGYSLDPISPPTEPPYKEAIARRQGLR